MASLSIPSASVGNLMLVDAVAADLQVFSASRISSLNAYRFGNDRYLYAVQIAAAFITALSKQSPCYEPEG